MHGLYNFHFLNTVSAQLHDQLNAMTDTSLTLVTLGDLAKFQRVNNAVQGVYVLHYKGKPVYVGKASNVRNRLNKHLTKISGRKNIHLADFSYKALLLDKSMSTAANETVLLGLFQQTCAGMWNNGGFGPNDPGKERDTTKPGDFDSAYPIQEKYPISLSSTQTTVEDLLKEMKLQLPYVFRYQRLNTAEASTPIDVAGVAQEADSLFQAGVTALGTGWKGAIVSYGMVLYKNSKAYPFGIEIYP